MNFYNRVKFTTSTTGTGALTVGTASTGFRTPAQASIPDGTTLAYVIEDSGNAWETGYGVYTVSSTSLTRNVRQSSNGDSAINLSGSAIVRITLLAEDVPVSGAPTTAKYITSATDGNLDAEIVIPGMAGSPDRSGAGGTSIDLEFDDTNTQFTWDVAPDIIDSNTTLPSHLYMTNNDATTRYGLVDWTPGAGAFDVRMKCSTGNTVASGSNNSAIGLSLRNSDGSVRILLYFVAQVASGAVGNYSITAFTYASSTYTVRGSPHLLYSDEVYLRITRDGGNNISFWYSTSGKTWRFIATQALTITVSKAGVRTGADAAVNAYYMVDWFRAST